MMDTQTQHDSHGHGIKLSLAGLVMTLGIIYGDIGTSPLYVMDEVVGHKRPIDPQLILGAISCVFWTLTIQTTFKYVFLTLRADNNGEGGIFSLYSLVKRMHPYLIYMPIIGGATLLSEGIITPPISISAAVEGLHIINPELPVIPITIAIITAIFAFQRFGTAIVGRAFGPIMLVWFSMIAILGITHIGEDMSVLKAVNPMYAINLLITHPEWIAILGAVFLCTTGVEALYSDLGHCGLANIRVSWIYVKLCLLLNYFGQGAHLMTLEGKVLLESDNPFFMILPQDKAFLYAGVIIATLAAIVASQALISGAFTLVGEAIRLNLFPKVQVVFPSEMKGQLYIPAVNFMLWIGCIAIVLYFKKSSAMGAAYGLSVTVTMMMTTILMTYYLRLKRYPSFFVVLFFVIYLFFEGMFLMANLSKFWNGGYVTVIMSAWMSLLMWVWIRASHIKKKLNRYVRLESYLDQLKALSHDESLPKYATNLVFMSKAKHDSDVEEKIMYSILQKQPKRADIYWFVNIEVTNEPFTMEYKVTTLAPDDAIRVRFRLGFKVQQRISSYLRSVIEDLVANGEVNIESRYHSLKENNVAGDFRFVILEDVLSTENNLPFHHQFILSLNLFIKHLTAAPEKWFGLETSLVEVEKVPLVISRKQVSKLKRVF